MSTAWIAPNFPVYMDPLTGSIPALWTDWAVVLDATPTMFRGVLSTGYTVQFNGSFTYSATSITASGVITSATVSLNGNTIYAVTDAHVAIQSQSSVPVRLFLTGDDVIFGSNYADVLAGLSGNDTIIGGGGDDLIFGGAGYDTARYSTPMADVSSVLGIGGKVFIATSSGVDGLFDIERLAFSDGAIDLTHASQATMNGVRTAYAGVLRLALDDASATKDAAIIDNFGPVAVNYLSALINVAQDSTVPALVVHDFVFDRTPTSVRLDSLSAFALFQVMSPGYQATANPRIGAYEALGLGFAQTTEFQARFGSGTDMAFIISTYQQAFGRSATAAQVSHFQAQIDYFESLYLGAGISAGTASIGARGAVVGQMLGFATAETGNPYQAAATAFLRDAADGSASYAVDLVGTYGGQQGALFG